MNKVRVELGTLVGIGMKGSALCLKYTKEAEMGNVGALHPQSMQTPKT